MNRIGRIARTSLVGAALAGGAVLAVPAVAGAQDDDVPDTTVESDRESGPWQGVLDALVDEGIITQDQADAVLEGFQERWQEARAERQERRDARDDILTETLGLDEEAIAAARADGQTLAEIAEDQGVSVETLVDALMVPKLERLDERVADGDLSEEEAAERAEEIEERVTARVEGEPVEREGRRGFGRFHRGGGPDAEPAAASLST